MNGQQDNISHFGVEEILRYLSGKMSREETRIIERAMVDDDLLFDSVEGFKLMRETMTDEVIIQKAKALQNPHPARVEKTAVISPIRSFRWIYYAAAACLVVAAGWWVFSITRPDTTLSPEMAVTEATELADSIPSDLAEVSDKDEKPSTIQSDIPANQKQEVAKTKEISIKDAPGSKDVAAISEATEKPAPSSLQAEGRNATATEIADAKKRVATMSKSEPVKTINFISIDTSEAVPSISWDQYKKFLDNSLAEVVKTKPVRATISLVANGSFEKIELESTLPDSEIQSAIKIIESGPSWKNKTGKKAKAKLEWR